VRGWCLEEWLLLIQLVNCHLPFPHGARRPYRILCCRMQLSLLTLSSTTIWRSYKARIA
jgi:hypothetical protein